MSATVESSTSSQDQPGSTSPTVRQTAVFELTIQTNTHTSPTTLRRTVRTKARPVSMRSKENVLSLSSDDVLLLTPNNTLTDSTSSIERTFSSSSIESQNELTNSTSSLPESQTTTTTQTTNTNASNETTTPSASPSKTITMEESTPSTTEVPTIQSSQTTNQEPSATGTKRNTESTSSDSTPSTATQPVAIPGAEETKKEKSGSFFAASPSRAVTEDKPRRGTIQMSRSWSEEKAMNAVSPSSSPNSPASTTPSSSPSTTTTRPSGGKKTETGTLRFTGFLRSSKGKDKDTGNNNTSANNSMSEEHDALNDNSQLSSSPSTATESKSTKKRNNDSLRQEDSSSAPREKKSLWRRTMRLGRTSSDNSPSTSPSTKTIDRTTSMESASSDNDIRPSFSDNDLSNNNSLSSFENLRIEDMDFSTLEVEIPEAAVSYPSALKLIEDYLNNHTVNVGALSKEDMAAIHKSPTKSTSTVTSTEVDVFRRQQLDRYEKDMASQKDGRKKEEKDSWKEKFRFSKSSSKMEQPPSLPKQKELLEATIEATAQENEVMRKKIQELRLFVEFLTNEKNALSTMTHRVDRLEKSGKVYPSLPGSQANSQAPSVANSKANSPSTSPSGSPYSPSPISASHTM